MLGKFGSLHAALEFAYPNLSWDEHKFSSRDKKSSQRYIREGNQDIDFFEGG
jgi:hypothetical protein